MKRGEGEGKRASWTWLDGWMDESMISKKQKHASNSCIRMILEGEKGRIYLQWQEKSAGCSSRTNEGIESIIDS